MTQNQQNLADSFRLVAKDEENRLLVRIQWTNKGSNGTIVNIRTTKEIEDFLKNRAPARPLNPTQRGYRWSVVGKDQINFYPDDSGLLGDITSNNLFAGANIGILRIEGTSDPEGISIKAEPMTAQAVEEWARGFQNRVVAFYKNYIAEFTVTCEIRVKQVV